LVAVTWVTVTVGVFESMATACTAGAFSVALSAGAADASIPTKATADTAIARPAAIIRLTCRRGRTPGVGDRFCF
jgi:hypothetical protein